MSKIYSDKYFNNKEEVLLFTESPKFVEKIMMNFENLSLLEKFDPVGHDNMVRISECENAVSEKFRFSDNSVLKNASDMLAIVLFESKEQPWGMFVHALNHYVEWLYTHSIDVALISSILAIELNYSEEKLKSICLGALLHDIGKLMIPRRIIQKPGKLDDQEWSLMKQHCILGYALIKESNLPKECTDIILQHHECLDGSGYPYGLHDNQIADTAKIVIIADILDAITSYRPYKSAQSLSVAIGELKKQDSKYAGDIIRILKIYL